MSLTTSDIDNLPDWNASRLLKAVEHAIVQLTLGGQEYAIAGKRFRRADLGQLKNLRDELKREVAEADSTTGTLSALVRFGKAQ